MASLKVVFDCVVFAQALLNDRGPAAACLDLARSQLVHLVWSDYVLAEIRELPEKLPASMQITGDKVEAFIQDVATFAEIVGDVPSVYTHPLDPDDSHYVNLALAAAATLITTRDRHLLQLMDRLRPESAEFQRRFPNLEIVTPVSLLARIRARKP